MSDVGLLRSLRALYAHLGDSGVVDGVDREVICRAVLEIERLEKQVAATEAKYAGLLMQEGDRVREQSAVFVEAMDGPDLPEAFRHILRRAADVIRRGAWQ